MDRVAFELTRLPVDMPMERPLLSFWTNRAFYPAFLFNDFLDTLSQLRLDLFLQGGHQVFVAFGIR